MTLTTNFGFTLLAPNQAQKDVVVNGDFTQIDSLLQLNVVSIGLNTPPNVTQDQVKYIVGTAPTGVWAGHANALAIWQANGSFWQFYAPQGGWVAYSQATNNLYAYNQTAAAWQLLAANTGSSFLGEIAAITPSAGTIIEGNGTQWVGVSLPNTAMMFALIFGG